MAAAISLNQSELLDCTAVSTVVNFNDTSVAESVSDAASEDADKSSADEDHDDTMNDESLVKSDSDHAEKEQQEVKVTEKKPPKKKVRKSREALDTNAAERIKSSFSSRERKQVERFVAPNLVTKKERTTVIAPGKGDKFSDIPSVANFIAKQKPLELNVLYYIAYGRMGAKAVLKKNLRLFSGYPFDEESSEFEKIKQGAMKRFDMPSIKKICSEFGTLSTGKTKQEALDILMKFCLKPCEVDLKSKAPKSPKSKAKESPKRKVSMKKGTSSPKKTKSPGKKRKQKDSGEGESDEEQEPDKDSDHSDAAAEPPTKKSRGVRSSPVGKKVDKKSKDEDESDGVELSESEPESNEDSGSDYGKRKSKNKKRKKSVAAKAKPSKSKGKAKPKPKKKPTPTKKSSKGKVQEEASDDEDEDAEVSSSNMPNDREIEKAVKKILDSADLDTVTMKMVLEQMREKYASVDLEPKKGLIKEFVKKILK